MSTEPKPDNPSNSGKVSKQSLETPVEHITQESIAESHRESITINPKKPEGFEDKARLLYKTHTVYDISVRITEKELKLGRYCVNDEFVSFAKKPEELGPSNYQVTWNAMANIVLLTASHCLPMNRVASMLKNKFGVFQSSQISRILTFIAEMLLPIYLELADNLAECSHMSGDDTGTRVLYQQEDQEKDKKRHKTLVKLDEKFGRTAPLADGSGIKKKLNVSPRSCIDAALSPIW